MLLMMLHAFELSLISTLNAQKRQNGIYLYSFLLTKVGNPRKWSENKTNKEHIKN